MLHRIVSRSVVVLAATMFLASCEDNTTGTPLTPPDPSTAVYVTPVIPDGGYTTEEVSLNIGGVDTLVTVVSPNPVFEVVYPDGTPGTGQTINFNINLPGLLQDTKGTVGSDGLVSPGYWVIGERPVQRIIASPASGEAGYIDIDQTPPEPEDD